ncbi:hypothetical protein NMQ03_16205 [Arthrobacter sp. DNA4]|uniref:hypothetical protein n=1 Tax=Micrococcaceae TaxID=1268 RepID=UPI0020CDE305|nr:MULTISPECIES: hypothetical protein [Micrococcaceae]UTT68751.1 hypothetical protein NMQ03_16205 [Arthrobacter sp. DNA4]WRT12998.1 hypothetical protein VIK36_16810 [Pseudarthrobacter sp. LT1]
MTSLKHLLQDTYARQMFVFVVVGLALSAMVPFGSRFLTGDSPVLVLAAAVLPLLLAVALIVTPRVSKADQQAAGGSQERLGAALLLYLSPVLLLNAVYPLVSPAMAGIDVAGVPLTYVVLASSVTVPWLAQAACLPIYRVLGDLMEERNLGDITRRFCQFWPLMFVQSLPLVAVFAVPLWLATGWSWDAMMHYVVLCVLHLLFVQSLVLANVANRRGLWAAAWSGYAAALFLAPAAWWLPPLVGTATQLVAMRSGLRHLSISKHLGARVFGTDLVRGLLMGAVLWADKYALFLVTGGAFQVVAVFAAMLPAVIAYNFYFVHLAPGVDRALGRLHHDIATAPVSVLKGSSSRLVRVLDRSVVLTGAIAGLLTLSVSLAVSGLDPANTVLTVASALASWSFMMLTLLNYELDFIGEKVTPQILGAVHLAVCILAFAGGAHLIGTSMHSASYLILGAADFVLIAVGWTLYKRHWSQPEYTLFWRHATTW